MTSGQREVPAPMPPRASKYYKMLLPERLDELLAAERERDAAVSALTKVRKLHTEYEGRCGHCVEWCDCLDEDPAALVANCAHGNVPWPCPTVAALPSVDSPEEP